MTSPISVSASPTALAGSSTKSAWTTRQRSLYRSRSPGSSARISRDSTRSWRASRSASAAERLPAVSTVRSYSDPNWVRSRSLRRRWPAHQATPATITIAATNSTINRVVFIAGDNPTGRCRRGDARACRLAGECQSPTLPGRERWSEVLTSLGRALLGAVRAVRDDFDALEGDETVGHHGVDLGQDGSDPVLLVDDLDEHGQVGRERQDPRGVEVVAGAETLDPADHRRPGQTSIAQQMDDRLVQRPPMPAVGFADVDPGEQALTFDLHESSLPSVRPTSTATIPITDEPTTLARARAMAPSSARRQLSSISVENVV